MASLEAAKPGTTARIVDWLKRYKTAEGKGENALASEVQMVTRQDGAKPLKHARRLKSCSLPFSYPHFRLLFPPWYLLSLIPSPSTPPLVPFSVFFFFISALSKLLAACRRLLR